MIQFMFFITFSFSFWLNNTSHFYSFTADFFGGGGAKNPRPHFRRPLAQRYCQKVPNNN